MPMTQEPRKIGFEIRPSDEASHRQPILRHMLIAFFIDIVIESYAAELMHQKNFDWISIIPCWLVS